MADLSTQLPVGTVLGAFEITGFVASGGMGSVYKAKNRLTGHTRALKVMLPALAQKQEFLARFVREIQITASIEHPNVVRVFEPGIDGELIFLPMELLEGETLASLLKRGRLAPAQAIDILLNVGRAVAVFHEQGVLHRDLKPSNIFLARGPDGSVTPKVLDFGAARPREVIDEATSTGMVIGSPHYMPVEQASGARDLDARVDQYALAVILYQALTRTRPFENDDTGHVLAKVLGGASYRRPRGIVPELPASLEAVVLRGMARDRDDRYASLPEFLSALEATTHEDRTLAATSTLELVLPSEEAPFALVEGRVSSTGPSSRGQRAPHPLSTSTNTNTGQAFAMVAEPAPRSKVWGVLGSVALLAVMGGVSWRLFAAGSTRPPAAVAGAVTPQPASPPRSNVPVSAASPAEPPVQPSAPAVATSAAFPSAPASHAAPAPVAVEPARSERHHARSAAAAAPPPTPPVVLAPPPLPPPVVVAPPPPPVVVAPPPPPAAPQCVPRPGNPCM